MTQRHETAMLDMMERDNNQLADKLAGKVSRLKQISLNLKGDIDDDNDYLDNMDADTMSTTGLLSGSINRFTSMSSSGKQNRKLMCRIVLVSIALFLILYFILSHKAG